MDKKSLVKMTEIEEFLYKLITYDEQDLLMFDTNSVNTIYGYAEALVRWEKDNFNPGSWYSTDGELMLKYKDQLIAQFKLPIMNREDGEKHAEEMRKIMNVYTKDTRFFN